MVYTIQNFGILDCNLLHDWSNFGSGVNGRVNALLTGSNSSTVSTLPPTKSTPRTRDETNKNPQLYRDPKGNCCSLKRIPIHVHDSTNKVITACETCFRLIWALADPGVGAYMRWDLPTDDRLAEPARLERETRITRNSNIWWLLTHAVVE